MSPERKKDPTPPEGGSGLCFCVHSVVKPPETHRASQRWLGQEKAVCDQRVIPAAK